MGKLGRAIRNYLHPSYMKRQLLQALSLGDPPEKIAIGVAVGVFLGVFPTFYAGIPLAALGARLFKFNVAAAVAGTAIATPLTGPFIIVASAFLGGALTGADWTAITKEYQEFIGELGAGFRSGFDLGPVADLLGKEEFWSTVRTTILTYLAGNLILCALSSVPAYFATKRAVVEFRRRRGAIA